MVAASKRLCNTEAQTTQQEQQLATVCVCVCAGYVCVCECGPYDQQHNHQSLPPRLCSMDAENVRTIHHMLSLRLGSRISCSFCWQLLKLPAGCLSPTPSLFLSVCVCVCPFVLLIMFIELLVG